MPDAQDIEKTTIDRAVVLNTLVVDKKSDIESLYVLLGKQDKAIAKSPELGADPLLDPLYDGTHMGLLDDVREIGRRIARDWARRLHGLICGGGGSKAEREKLLSALGISQIAAIGAATAQLLAMGMMPALAAPLAVIVVQEFLLPAGKTVCEYWGEKLDEQPA